MRGIAAKMNLPALTRAAFACLIGMALLAASLPARAGDDDDSVPLDTKLLRGLMDQLGLQRDGTSINYDERPPLVLPPNDQLPPPEQSGAAIANNPAWPVDPDVQRAKQEKLARKSRLNAQETLLKEQRPLSESEMAPGPKPRNTQSVDNGSRAYGDAGDRLPPSQLGDKGFSFFGKMFGKDDPVAAQFTGEPARTVLTDPPPGYQTPSPDQPYGVGAKAAPKNDTNWLQTHGMLEGTK